MTERSADHTTFVIERTYPTATPARTFLAWADAKAKEVWMDDPGYRQDDSKTTWTSPSEAMSVLAG